jgi:hypothetical protein
MQPQLRHIEYSFGMLSETDGHGSLDVLRTELALVVIDAGAVEREGLASDNRKRRS